MKNPPIVKIQIQEEIINFDRNIFERLLPCFASIEEEAKAKRRAYLEQKSKNFNPDIDDEGIIEEGAYFIEINHFLTEEEMKHDFIKSSVVSLSHILERSNKSVFGCHDTERLKPILLSSKKYDISECDDWLILKDELRVLANAIKHGKSSKAMTKVPSKYLKKNQEIFVTKEHLREFISAMQNYWNKAL